MLVTGDAGITASCIGAMFDNRTRLGASLCRSSHASHDLMAPLAASALEPLAISVGLQPSAAKSSRCLARASICCVLGYRRSRLLAHTCVSPDFSTEYQAV